MLTAEILLARIGSRPEIDALVREFRPPPRFAGKHFADYRPRHPSQDAALQRVARVAEELERRSAPRGWRSLFRRSAPPPAGGIYLDGGFGVGKTHLLASLWNAAPEPKAYLSFDELMYFVGLAGPGAAARAFAGSRLIAVDEWELDDPGNLKMALAFLREVLAEGIFVAVTSNALPLDLGAGRFSQKDFLREIEEMAAAFEVVRVDGTDYRQRELHPDSMLALLPPGAPTGESVPGSLRIDFDAMLHLLSRLHPIRYRELARSLSSLRIDELQRIEMLPDALRWVHFVDALYDAGVPLSATGSVRLPELFPAHDRVGPYGTKLSRCISRLAELLREGREAARSRAESA